MEPFKGAEIQSSMAQTQPSEESQSCFSVFWNCSYAHHPPNDPCRRLVGGRVKTLKAADKGSSKGDDVLKMKNIGSIIKDEDQVMVCVFSFISLYFSVYMRGVWIGE